MGGIIKLTLKEKNKLTTIELHTAFLNAQYSGLNDLCNIITKEQLLKDAEYGEESEDMIPTAYGHIFIDRDNFHIFNLNDFNNIDKIIVGKIKNNIEEYKINPTPEKDLSDPRCDHTENNFLYNLQSCIDYSDEIFLIGDEDNEKKELSKLCKKEALSFAEETLDIFNEYKILYPYSYVVFKNSQWKIENHPVSRESILMFKDYLSSLDIDIDNDDFNYFLEDY